MTKLADKIEAAEGPSRELDAEIGLAIGLPTRDRTGEPGWHGLYFVGSLPSYTHSLDAAMTLIPDEHRAGVIYHAMQRIQQTGFSNSTFLQRLILEVVAAALRAGDTDAG